MKRRGAEKGEVTATRKALLFLGTKKRTSTGKHLATYAGANPVDMVRTLPAAGVERRSIGVPLRRLLFHRQRLIRRVIRKLLEGRLDLPVAVGDQLPVGAVQADRLPQFKQMVLAPVALQGFGDRLGGLLTAGDRGVGPAPRDCALPPGWRR